MVNIRIYVEGGGDHKSLRIDCRRGFSEFLGKAGLSGKMPRIIACGRRNSAFRDFRTALQLASSSDFPILLVDAEGPVRGPDHPWVHLKNSDNWDRPAGAENDQCFFMAQIMESWFLADSEALAGYYGKRFQKAALPGNPRVEEIPKDSVIRGLERATRNTRKGTYSKGRHSFHIIACIDPDKVRRAAPCAERLFFMLNKKSGR